VNRDANVPATCQSNDGFPTNTGTADCFTHNGGE
jgi:hypothetical protein